MRNFCDRQNSWKSELGYVGYFQFLHSLVKILLMDDERYVIDLFQNVLDNILASLENEDKIVDDLLLGLSFVARI